MELRVRVSCFVVTAVRVGFFRVRVRVRVELLALVLVTAL